MAVSFATQAVVSGLSNPTSLQFGPDGRLYVAQQDGLIKVYDVTQPVPGQWAAAEAETISAIKNIPNHNDDGSLNTSLLERQVTGILVTGTADNPLIYVTSSDPRIANFADLDLDTNSEPRRQHGPSEPDLHRCDPRRRRDGERGHRPAGRDANR
jgi:WD40 repeat protein